MTTEAGRRLLRGEMPWTERGLPEAIAAIEAEAAANMLATVTSSAAEIAATERAVLLAELEAGVRDRLTPKAPSDLSYEDFMTRDMMAWCRDQVLDLIRKAGEK